MRLWRGEAGYGMRVARSEEEERANSRDEGREQKRLDASLRFSPSLLARSLCRSREREQTRESTMRERGEGTEAADSVSRSFRKEESSP